MPKFYKRLVIIGPLLLAIGGFGQSGFYLTYPCKEGSAEIQKFDRNKKDICLTAEPIITTSDIFSLTQPVRIGNQVFFDLYLTDRGVRKLEQVYGIADIIAFMVGDKVLFLLDTEKDRITGTIRVHIVGRKESVPLHAELLQEIEQAKNNEVPVK